MPCLQDALSDIKDIAKTSDSSCPGNTSSPPSKRRRAKAAPSESRPTRRKLFPTPPKKAAESSDFSGDEDQEFEGSGQDEDRDLFAGKFALNEGTPAVRKTARRRPRSTSKKPRKPKSPKTQPKTKVEHEAKTEMKKEFFKKESDPEGDWPEDAAAMAPEVKAPSLALTDEAQIDADLVDLLPTKANQFLCCIKSSPQCVIFHEPIILVQPQE